MNLKKTLSLSKFLVENAKNWICPIWPKKFFSASAELPICPPIFKKHVTSGSINLEVTTTCLSLKLLIQNIIVDMMVMLLLVVHDMDNLLDLP